MKDKKKLGNIDKDNAILELPSMRVFPSYIEALEEGHRPGIQPVSTAEEIQKIKENPETFMEDLNSPALGTYTTPSGDVFQKVPYEHLWLTCDNIFIGEVSFRHELNEMLKKFGGHVGYGIRPSFSGKGFGTLALKLVVERAKDIGIDKLLVTCGEDNFASQKIIERNGGEYIETKDNPYGYDGRSHKYGVSIT